MPLMGAGLREVPPVVQVMPGELMDVGVVAAVVQGLLLFELQALVGLVLVELAPWHAFVAPKWALVAAVVGAVDGHHQMKLTENPTI